MKLRNQIRGQVRIKAEGTQLSRFLSLLLARDILYQNAAYKGSALYLDLAAGDYRAAVSCAKKAGIRIRIAAKRGWPFLFFRHRRRKWTLLFILPMLIMVGLMPRFVWTIELEGLEQITQVEMLRRLEEAGVEEGMWQSELDTAAVKSQLMLRYEDLSFLSLSLEGTTLRVVAAEKLTAPEMVERSAACDVVAKETCIVYSMVTESGKPLVQKGDVVQQGDLLIQGIVNLTDDDGNETVLPAHAAGEVYGKRTCQLEAEIDRIYEDKIWLEGEYGSWVFWWGSSCFEVKNPFRKEQPVVFSEEEWLRIPFLTKFCVSRRQYWPYEPEEKEYTTEEMQQRLTQRLEQEKAQLLADGDRVLLDESISFEETETGMKGILTLILMEDVAQTIPQ